MKKIKTIIKRLIIIIFIGAFIYSIPSAWSDVKTSDASKQDYSFMKLPNYGYDLAVVDNASGDSRTILIFDFDRQVATHLLVTYKHHSSNISSVSNIYTSNISGSITDEWSYINTTYKYDPETDKITHFDFKGREIYSNVSMDLADAISLLNISINNSGDKRLLPSND